MKKSSQRELIYRKKQRDDKNSTYHKNRSLGSKGWTNGVFEDLHRDFATFMFYKLQISEWDYRLSHLLRNQIKMDARRLKRTRKVNYNETTQSFEKWKKRTKLDIKKWINASNQEILIDYMFWKSQKSFRANQVNSQQNLWEKKFNGLDTFNKNNAER
ncbi:hypothetical protein N9N60_00950 [Candidatus Pelagibacter bacterium]|jgi:hypothetical protein|nr:hypothetical protein [Candidatus Pelagibacter bacterium]MDA8845277.1 hypothetical protein [Candidatus Pelagibacter bacterium]